MDNIKFEITAHSKTYVLVQTRGYGISSQNITTFDTRIMYVTAVAVEQQ